MLMKIKCYVHIPSLTYKWDAKKDKIMKKKALWAYFMHALWMTFEWNLKCVCALYISYEWNVKKSIIMKRDNLICTSYEWGFMRCLNGMLSSYVYEKKDLYA